MKAGSTSLLIRRMQTQTTTRYTTPNHQSRRKKLTIPNAEKDTETTGILMQRCNMVQILQKMVWFLIKFNKLTLKVNKFKPTSLPSKPTLGYLPMRNENLCSYILQPIVYNSFIQNCQNLKTTKTSSGEWLNKLWYNYIRNKKE